MENNLKTINVKEDLWNEMMLLKISTKAKSLDQMLRFAIDKLKRELNGVKDSPDASKEGKYD